MSIIEYIGGPITYRYLMKKTKSDLANLLLGYCETIGKKDKRIEELKAVLTSTKTDKQP